MGEDEEEWVDVRGFESRYLISNKGRIYRKALTVKCSNGQVRYYKPKMLKLSKNTAGYWTVHLRSKPNEKTNSKRVHRVLMDSFGYDIEGMSINHIDGDRGNNDIKNLEVCTPKENTHHMMYTLGKGYGDNCKYSKLSQFEVDMIRWEWEVEDNRRTQEELSRVYNVTRQTISDVVRYRSWDEKFIKHELSKLGDF